MADKDSSLIPKGCYCYDANGVCPYWSLREDRPEQYNGWCDYLGKGDIEIAQEMEVRNAKTGEVCKACDLPFPMSLLWDQCKECGIQCDDEDDDEEVECADNPCC
jgi:hypothetical protein